MGILQTLTPDMQGGKFGHGFAAAGVTQAFAKGIDSISKGARFSAKRIMAAAIVGGTASRLSGGKFANGAVTGAFSRMFNDESHYEVKRSLLKRANEKWNGMGFMDDFKKEYPYEYELFEEYASTIETELWTDGEIGYLMEEQAIVKFADFAKARAGNYYRDYVRNYYDPGKNAANFSLAKAIPIFGPLNDLATVFGMKDFVPRTIEANKIATDGPQYLLPEN